MSDSQGNKTTLRLWFFVCLFLFFCFETDCHGAQAGLGLCYAIEDNHELLTLPPKYWYYRHVDYQA